MAEGISTRVARRLKQALGRTEERAAATVGTATVVATEGGVWLSIPGSDAPTPVNGAVTCDVAKGDVVGYRIEGGRLSVTGSVSKPSIGETKAAGFVEPVAEAVEELKRETENAAARTNRVAERSRVIAGIANAAQMVAEATNQHFFSDDNGVHVTQAEQEEWEQAHEGPNMLLNSLGQLFRDGLTNLISITTQAGARAITFWDGEGNDAENVTASFGGDGAQIGRTGESHVVLTSNTMAVTNYNGTLTVFEVDGSSRPSMTVGSRDSSVSDHGRFTATFGTGNTASTRNDGETDLGIGAVAQGASCSARGNGSFAGGENATAGACSLAHGRNVTASKDQTVIGFYNDNDPSDLFEIGNGNPTTSSNAFSVDRSGNVTAAGTLNAARQESTVTVDTSNVTERSGYNNCWHNGVVCTVQLGINLVANLASGSSRTIGTVPEGWRPPYTAYCAVYGSAPAIGGMQGYITDAGAIVIRNNSGAAVTSSPNIYVMATYAM